MIFYCGGGKGGRQETELSWYFPDMLLFRKGFWFLGNDFRPKEAVTLFTTWWGLHGFFAELSINKTFSRSAQCLHCLLFNLLSLFASPTQSSFFLHQWSL